MAKKKKQRASARGADWVPEAFATALGPLLTAVDAGDLAVVRSIYNTSFNTDSCREDLYVASTLLPGCLRRAAHREHWHVVHWIIRDARPQIAGLNLEGRPSHLFMEEAVADVLWAHIMGEDGTVTHALQMCGKDWWRQSRHEHGAASREAYEVRTFFDWDDWNWVCDESAYQVYHDRPGTLKKARESFVLTEEWARANPCVVMFKYSTPDFVSSVLAARGDCGYPSGPHLVPVLIERALKTQQQTHATRLLGIAEDLVDMGFSFEYYTLLVLAGYSQHRRLLLKMMRICGGIALVGRQLRGDIPAIAKAHCNLILVWVAFKMRVLAARARERAWSPTSAHVFRLEADFAANARGLTAAPLGE